MMSSYLPSEDSSIISGSSGTLESEVSHIAAKEVRFVRRTKGLVLLILAASAAAASALCYKVLRNAEDRQFRNQLQNYGSELTSIATNAARNIIDSIEDVAVGATSYAIADNATWPFVVVPNFSTRGEHFARLTGTSLLGLTPFVFEEEREEFEAFGQANARKLLDLKPEEETPPFSPVVAPFLPDIPLTATPGIFDRPVYLPSFHLHPQVVHFINLDSLIFPIAFQSATAIVKTRGIFVSSISSVLSETSVPDSWPTTSFAAPVFRDLEQGNDVVALASSTISWHTFFENVVPDNGDSLIIVLSDSCEGLVTYRTDGPDVAFIGSGDLHDPAFDDFVVDLPITLFAPDDPHLDSRCLFSARFYPTAELHDMHFTNEPTYSAIVVVMVFVITCLFFLVHDFLVQRMQGKIDFSARRSGAIVDSLFPKSVVQRLEEAERISKEARRQRREDIGSSSDKHGSLSPKLLASKPIADLFPRVTVMFADVAGFTAWASTRQPAEVFTFLEQTYSVFDGLAKRRKIFKVETVGDCYVAAAGLPEERSDHAEAMARFANDCRNRMSRIVRDLEVMLGPDTADLRIRIGLHSGPVTGGVLRGEKTRFQLFGDTVNTASRIEHAGEGGQVLMSKQTADILVAKGLGDWVTEREGGILAKGKGILRTYWLAVGRRRRGSKRRSDEASTAMLSESDADFKIESEPMENEGSSSSVDDISKTGRLIDWSVDILYSQLQQIAAVRDDGNNCVEVFETHDPSIASQQRGLTALAEVQEIISLADEVRARKRPPSTIDLGQDVRDQLRDYVSKIAGMYHPNSFHSFDHASHVTQSTSKMLSRIVRADQIDFKTMKYQQPGAHELHDHTFGITSDPLISFACIFSALIHDVDHLGVPNSQLVKEGFAIASLYGNKSVAEQNSVDLAWSLLMEPMYCDLCRAIYSTRAELVRFRQLVVNSVMATDIVDKELGAARKARWAKAFAKQDDEPDHIGDVVDDVLAPVKPISRSSELADTNRKATIVIEHLIQASDVSHTMQHWHVYIKWNEKLFHELYKAYLEGRAEKDPSEGWYKGEIGFFDFYVIPLARKLADCGVFGVSSDECLNYALANRAEWERKGNAILLGYMQKYVKS